MSHRAHPRPTSQPWTPPCTLTSLPAPSQPATHACIPPCTPISYLAHSPGAPHTHLPPCTSTSVPSYPTSHIPNVPHILVSHLTHSYPTPRTHFRDLKSHPISSSPCPARSCHTPHIPRPRWRLGTSVRGGFVLLCPPWPHPVAFGEGPVALPGWGSPPLIPRTPRSSGAPSPGWVSPAGAPRGSPAPGVSGGCGALFGVQGPAGRGGPGLPRRAWPLISCLTGSLGSAAEKHSQTSRSSRGALNPCLAAPHAGVHPDCAEPVPSSRGAS